MVNGITRGSAFPLGLQISGDRINDLDKFLPSVKPGFPSFLKLQFRFLLHRFLVSVQDVQLHDSEYDKSDVLSRMNKITGTKAIFDHCGQSNHDERYILTKHGYKNAGHSIYKEGERRRV